MLARRLAPLVGLVATVGLFVLHPAPAAAQFADVDFDGAVDVYELAWGSDYRDPLSFPEADFFFTCFDATDNDGDLFTDVADPGCNDQDWDGLDDQMESFCGSNPTSATRTPEHLIFDAIFGAFTCSDGMDNDGDGDGDAADPGCAPDADLDEVPDSVDNCPTVFNPAQENVCPFLGTVLFTADTDDTYGWLNPLGVPADSHMGHLPGIDPGVILTPSSASLDGVLTGPLAGISYGRYDFMGNLGGRTAVVTVRYDFPAAGLARLEWEVSNVIDDFVASALAVDNVRLNGSVLFGFESGIPGGFTALGVVGTSTAVSNLAPTEGSRLLYLDSTGGIAPIVDTSDGTSGSWLTSSTFEVLPGDVLHMDLAFLTNDGGDFHDYGAALLHFVASECGNSVVEPGEDCDDGNTAAGDCCSALCQVEPAGTACRAAAGPCDVAETCGGTSAACPADQLAAAGTTCQASTGACDPAETCTGTSITCPADQLAAAGTVCRAAAGACDVAETCNGMSSGCPADGFAPDGTPCADGNACTTGDTCQGGACSGTPTACAVVASLSLNRTSVVGGVSSTGTVMITNPAPAGGVEVMLESSDPAVATVPPTVTVQAGAWRATFTVNTMAVGSITRVTTSASIGPSSRSATLTLQPIPLASLTMTPTNLVGGASSTGKVTLVQAAPPGGMDVSLASSNPGVAPVPAIVHVDEGATTAMFTVTTTPVAAKTSVKISASAGGVSKSVKLNVRPR